MAGRRKVLPRKTIRKGATASVISTAHQRRIVAESWNIGAGQKESDGRSNAEE
jgi:hypothetical protein